MNKEIEHSAESWDGITRFFHWASAIWVSGLLGLGLVMTNLVKESGAKFELYQLHKTYAFVFGLFLFGRLASKFLTPRPKTSGNAWMHKAAVANQALMLTLLFALVVSGYAVTSLSILPIPIDLFGLKVPALLKPDLVMEQTAILTHHIFAFVLIALIVVHIGAALFHHFILKDKTLVRMLRRRP